MHKLCHQEAVELFVDDQDIRVVFSFEIAELQQLLHEIPTVPTSQQSD